MTRLHVQYIHIDDEEIYAIYFIEIQLVAYSINPRRKKGGIILFIR